MLAELLQNSPLIGPILHHLRGHLVEVRRRTAGPMQPTIGDTGRQLMHAVSEFMEDSLHVATVEEGRSICGRLLDVGDEHR